MYKRWRPDSRRDRRRGGSRARRAAARGADRTFLTVLGLFSLAAILVLAAFFFLGGG